METKYKAGDVVKDKSNKAMDIVVLFPLKIKWRGYQRYRVRWYDREEFQTGAAYEQELTTN